MLKLKTKLKSSTLKCFFQSRFRSPDRAKYLPETTLLAARPRGWRRVRTSLKTPGTAARRALMPALFHSAMPTQAFRTCPACVSSSSGAQPLPAWLQLETTPSRRGNWDWGCWALLLPHLCSAPDASCWGSGSEAQDVGRPFQQKLQNTACGSHHRKSHVQALIWKLE